MAVEDNGGAFKKSTFIFKDKSFKQIYPITNTTKKKVWKSLKQIIAQERTLFWLPETIHYSFVNTTSNLKPFKKYSDISGLPASYTDPYTKLFYATSDEFCTIRNLPMDITARYLALRGVSNIVG